MTVTYVIFWHGLDRKSRGEEIIQDGNIVDHIRWGHFDLRGRSIDAIYEYEAGAVVPNCITAQVAADLARDANVQWWDFGERPRRWIAEFIESACNVPVPRAADECFACE